MPHDSDKRKYLVGFTVVLLLLQAHAPGFAQSDHGTLNRGWTEVAGQTVHLDPTLDISTPTLESAVHAPLPEEYIWSGQPGDEGESTFLYFRKSFSLRVVPRVATLYAAGPSWMMVYLNGHQLANGFHDPKERVHPFVLAIDVSGQVHAGRNLIAVMASQGNSLVLKIVPAAAQVMKPALLISDATWKCDSRLHKGWELPSLDDRGWQDAKSLGGIEANSDFFQSNQDAGLYRWPGYDGISPFLAHLFLKASTMVYGFEGMGRFSNISALLEHPYFSPGLLKPPPPGKREVIAVPQMNVAMVFLPAQKLPESEYPYLLLDFGKECAGRIRVVSDSPSPMRVEVQYGESAEEALSNPYLGANVIDVPPYGTAYGPKSAFAYAVVRFLGGTSPLRFKAVDVDYIYYPVKQTGSFESSDPVINKIWQEGAYTAHLCMQDAVWDGPKRDRLCLAGGLDISERVISSVFGDRFLIDKSLQGLIADAGNPVSKDVNGIPGYSALWVMCEADYFRHTGDIDHLRFVRESLKGLMEFMAPQIDEKELFKNSNNRPTFIDWSPDLDSDSPESRRVTVMEMLWAFSEGAWLLEQAGDPTTAQKFQRLAEKLRADTLKNALDPNTNTFGGRWQTNAMAVYAGLADANELAAVWEKILSRRYQFNSTPHMNFYAISAMAEAGRRTEALDWLSEYWGGMLRPDTTTFWEGYDLRWPKEHFHGHLQSAHGEGYFVSLCHGWSSGPTAWLMEQVLGIHPVAAGFARVNIRPDLCGLDWARGTEPCPQGLIKVDYRHDKSDFKATVGVPEGVVAQVSMPVDRGEGSMEIDGRRVSGVPVEDGARLTVTLSGSGLHELRTHLSMP
jgi:hypothetical protein